MDAVFNIGAHYAGRGFRPQRHGTFPAVGKGVHFFLHHVCFRADGTAEKLGVFEKGRAQFAKGVTGKYLSRSLFHTQEEGAVFWEKVGETFDGLNLCHNGLRRGMREHGDPAAQGRPPELGQAVRIETKLFSVKTEASARRRGLFRREPENIL